MNTQELISNLTGKNKSFIKRVSKHQEEKYGNVDIFSAWVDKNWRTNEVDKVSISFGDYWIEFHFDYKGRIYDTYGNGQGHKYHKSLEECAKELFQKFNGGNKNENDF